MQKFNIVLIDSIHLKGVPVGFDKKLKDEVGRMEGFFFHGGVLFYGDFFSEGTVTLTKNSYKPSLYLKKRLTVNNDHIILAVSEILSYTRQRDILLLLFKMYRLFLACKMTMRSRGATLVCLLH